MAEEKIVLIDPTEDLRGAYADLVADYRVAGESAIPGSGAGSALTGLSGAPQDFAAFVQKLRDAAAGIGLPAGHVPGSTYWLVRDGEGRGRRGRRGQKILGTSNFRHALTAALLHEGGHIGYSIRPSARGRGYGTRQLALALAEARRRGIERALVTCDVDNVASARVIRGNGGVLESTVVSYRSGKDVQRYWIDLSRRGATVASRPPKA